MRISDIAKALDIPVSTIRFYERKGIIPKPLRSGTSRVYTQMDLKMLSFVKSAQSVGFSLADIAILTNANSEHSDQAKRCSEIAKQHRDAVRKQMKELQRVDTILTSLQKCGCQNFSECLLDDAIVEIERTQGD